jgi:hypothetical protein
MSRASRLAGPVGALAVAGLVLGFLSGCSASSGTVTASSTASGTSADKLVSVAASVSEPAAAAAVGVPKKLGGGSVAKASAHAGDVTWRSSKQTKGAWVRLGWGQSTTVDHIRIDGAGGASSAYLNAVVIFSDGSSIFVTPDAAGDVAVDIAPRKVTSALLRFATVPEGVSSVALRAFTVDDSATTSPAAGAASPAVSSSRTGAASALDDGDIGAGRLGTIWRPAMDDTAAWAGYSWKNPVTLASAQLAGTTGETGSASGRLLFSDGSSVQVSRISAGSDPLTTVAFTPRVVSWVRFEPAQQSGFALGEFRVLPSGSTPKVWPVASGVSVTSPPAESCAPAGPAVGRVQDSALALVCPATGTSVGDTATVVVHGPAKKKISAVAWTPAGLSGRGSIEFLAAATAGADGRSTLSFSTTGLPHGPFAIKVTLGDKTAVGADVPLYVQLDNTGGVKVASPGYAPSGLTLQFDDEFDGPLSISASGLDAKYAATKPIPGGGSEFGGAVFANPDRGQDNLATLDDSALRLRVQPIGNAIDTGGYNRQYLGGLLSSMRVGGSGFSAQYGYYEARILAPGGRGSWPAFWMQDAESATRSGQAYGEVDGVELYGHNTDGSCHSLHNWNTVGVDAKSHVDCLDDNGEGDWALTWHTYGVRIRPDGADYFIDGKQVASLSDLVNDTNPFYFMLNLETDGGWPTQLDPTGGTIDMYVDWVRVYT